MKKFVLVLCYIITVSGIAEAIDLAGLEGIGAISNFRATSTGVLFNCQDGSQLQVTVLAPDLIRVRASYRKPLPQRDHSWAIDKTQWASPSLKVTETSEAATITTDEVQIVVRRSPLIVEFRDTRTGKTINADERPMMFDPKTTRIAAAKKLGFD